MQLTLLGFLYFLRVMFELKITSKEKDRTISN